MYDILVYATNPESVTEIKELFPAPVHQVCVVDENDDWPVDVPETLFDFALAWEAPVQEVSKFLEKQQAVGLGFVPVVALTRDSSEADQLFALPLADVITLPTPRALFMRTIETLVHGRKRSEEDRRGMNWQGSLSEFNLIDLIQMVDAGRRSVEARLSQEGLNGRLVFGEGVLCDAQFRALSGSAALKKMVFWSRGSFQIRELGDEAVTNEIKLQNQEILLQLFEVLAKQDQLSRDLPDFTTQLLRNPLMEPGELTGLQSKILGQCQQAITIFELLQVLDDDGEDILLELKIMLEMNLIGDRVEVEAAIREAAETSNFSKVISSISSIFKRKPRESVVEYQFYESLPEESLLPLQFPARELSEDDRRLIEGKLLGGSQ